MSSTHDMSFTNRMSFTRHMSLTNRMPFTHDMSSTHDMSFTNRMPFTHHMSSTHDMSFTDRIWVPLGSIWAPWLRDEIQAAASAHPPRVSLELYLKGDWISSGTKHGKKPAFPLVYEAYPPAVKRTALSVWCSGSPLKLHGVSQGCIWRHRRWWTS